MGAAQLDCKTKVIEISPKEWLDQATLQTKINTAIATVTDANATNGVIDTHIVQSLGNYYLLIVYDF
tara:strand:- start:75 stop:275 length:201 start_codon:yes stop_codon:yes gene_type:complete